MSGAALFPKPAGVSSNRRLTDDKILCTVRKLFCKGAPRKPGGKVFPARESPWLRGPALWSCSEGRWRLALDTLPENTGAIPRRDSYVVGRLKLRARRRGPCRISGRRRRLATGSGGGNLTAPARSSSGCH